MQTTDIALDHFSRRLEVETDVSDVAAALTAGEQDFVLVDARSRESYEAGHLPGAISLPHGKMVESKMAAWPKETVFVTYCAGPHCNGAARGALRLAELGRPVKIMAGGITGWLDEGFALEAAAEPMQAPARRERDGAS